MIKTNSEQKAAKKAKTTAAAPLPTPHIEEVAALPLPSLHVEGQARKKRPPKPRVGPGAPRPLSLQNGEPATTLASTTAQPTVRLVAHSPVNSIPQDHHPLQSHTPTIHDGQQPNGDLEDNQSQQAVPSASTKQKSTTGSTKRLAPAASTHTPTFSARAKGKGRARDRTPQAQEAPLERKKRTTWPVITIRWQEGKPLDGRIGPMPVQRRSRDHMDELDDDEYQWRFKQWHLGYDPNIRLEPSEDEQEAEEVEEEEEEEAVLVKKKNKKKPTPKTKV